MQSTEPRFSLEKLKILNYNYEMSRQSRIRIHSYFIYSWARARAIMHVGYDNICSFSTIRRHIMQLPYSLSLCITTRTDVAFQFIGQIENPFVLNPESINFAELWHFVSFCQFCLAVKRLTSFAFEFVRTNKTQIGLTVVVESDQLKHFRSVWSISFWMSPK